MKNKQIAAKTMRHNYDTSAQAQVMKVKPPLVDKKYYPSLAETIAQSNVSFRNFKWEKAVEFFPSQPHMRTVDQYFPYAVGGELLVDYVNNKAQAAECATKGVALKKLGYRYLILDKMTDEFQAREQLEA